jgi:hypothetical protein
MDALCVQAYLCVAAPRRRCKISDELQQFVIPNQRWEISAHQHAPPARTPRRWLLAAGSASSVRACGFGTFSDDQWRN